MFPSPLLTLRSTCGLTSVSHHGSHLLTTSSNGELCQWDRRSGNRVSSWRPTEELVCALPLQSHGASSYTSVALQHKNGICIFDLSRSAVSCGLDVVSSNFARIRTLPLESDVLLCPSGMNGIACYDIRVPSAANGWFRTFRCNTVFPDSDSNYNALSPSKYTAGLYLDCNDLGSLQNFEAFPTLGPFHVVATYECGRVSIFDLRRGDVPVLSCDACTNVEALPSLSVWKSVLLVGDTKGEVSMFHVSDATGIRMLHRTTLCDNGSNPCVVGCLKVRDDGAIAVAGCWDNNIRILETRTLSVKAVLSEHRDSITDVHFGASTGEFVTSGLDGNAHVWNLFHSGYRHEYQ
ncbi:hypothetical protein X943_003099 [Babesia divergens]|uniref:Guanine nucleotide-binding protein subunit beta-like protein n=1 Tax=Babesia divergens TaxID=32595 RepID=A0AAD9G7L5_BABDI|nr:hypothetical protein X943_003099 [Babesia divergens]